MNRPPSTAGKSTNMPKKNWYKAPGGKIVWPNEMKLFLVSRVKEHISVLEGDSKVDPQHKLRVWEQIYKALVRRGMPDSDVRAVKKVWAGLRASTVEVYRRMETKRRNTRSAIEVTDLQRAVHEVIELKNKLATSGNSVMPMVSAIVPLSVFLPFGNLMKFQFVCRSRSKSKLKCPMRREQVPRTMTAQR